MSVLRAKHLISLVFCACIPASALATNGYFTHGVSTAEKGLAGAGAAYSQDTLAAGNNPAGMVWQGNRYDVGAALFAPMRSYTVTGTPAGPPAFGLQEGTVDSENEAFIIPQFGRNWMLDADSSIGLSIYGNGGMNTEYTGTPGTFYDGTAGVDLAQLFFATTYSAKLSENSSYGISAIIAYQRFEAKGLSNFAPFSTDPANLTNNGHDGSTGIGLRLGFQTAVAPGIRIGLAYQPKIDMSEFDDYAGLFAEQGDFDIPSNFTIGAAFDVGETGVFVIDFQQINYEDVASVSNPISNLQTNCPGSGCLGGDDGGGFGWQDMQIVKIGYQWQSGHDWTWRVGYSTGDQPIPEGEVLFNILAPGVMEDHFTFGFTRQLDNKSSLNFAAMYAPSVSVKGANAFQPSPPFGSQEIELEMDQYELAFTYNRVLD